MLWLITPGPLLSQKASVLSVVLLMATSSLALVLAPLLMPEGYNWIVHTTSESAAQSLGYAWLARLGFLLFGLAVLALASTARSSWGRGVVWMHLSFGLFMVSTAVFSHKPWQSGVAFDQLEDHLHSFTATAMGFAFAFGVLLRFVQRRLHREGGGVLDVLALLAATFIPLLMVIWGDIAGLVQRLMFGVAYIWYGKEAIQLAIKG